MGGATEQLNAAITWSDESTSDVTEAADWSSDDEAVATVDTDGLVTAVAAGTCEVTAEHLGVSDACTVTVTDPA